MAINFPSNPNNGDTLDVGQTTYAFNSTTGVWDIEAPASSGASTTVYADMAALIAATGMSNGDQAFVTANNNLYIYSGSGWYKVATVQNDSPSAITGVASSYALAIDGTATTITAVSTDPDGFPLTWSYATSGLGSIATISQVDNVFTITPSTDEANAGTFTLTLNATDGVNGAVSASTNLTLDFIFIVANSNYTTLLATATGTSDNNNITDASTNNHSITVNGDAYAGTFSPYRSGGYSTNFDGDGDYIKMSNSPGVSLDGEFVIELWTRFTIDDQGVSGANIRIFTTNDQGNSGNNLQLVIRKNQGTIGSVAVYTDNWKVSGTTAINDGKWHHVAITRDSSNNLKLFIDGTENDSTILSTNFTLTNGRLGTRDTGSNSSNYTGDISDFRIRRGVSTFSVPTSRLVSDSNTHILACHLPYFKDGSSNNNTLDLTGDGQIGHATIIHNGPYDYEEYDAADHGGSVYFDSTGDYLTLPTAPTLGTSDFEISMWLYPETIAGDDVIIDWRPSSTNGVYVNFFLASGVPKLFVDSADRITGSSALPVKVWSYLTLTRVSGSTKLYVNGTQSGSTYSDSNNYLTGSSRPTIGQAGYNPSLNLGFNGHMSDLVVKLSGNSSPSIPTSPVSSSGTSLHIKGTDASVINKSQNANLKLIGNTTGSTTQIKFADTKSMYFDGSGDRATATGVPDLGDDFTIECWVYSTATGNIGIVSSIDNVGTWGSNGYWSFGIYGGNLSLQIDDSSYSGASTSPSTNQWVHIAVTRTSNTIRYFFDGTLDSTTFSNSRTLKNPSGIVIGTSPNNNYIYNYTGYIQDFRITKGLARYTANFTAPTEPLKG